MSPSGASGRQPLLERPPNASRKLRLHEAQLYGIPFLIAIPLFALLAGLSGGELWKPVAKVALFYVVLLIGLRIVGKREFGQLSPIEIVGLMLIPNLAGPAIVEQTFVPEAIVAIFTLLALTFGTSLLKYLSKPAEKVLDGEPTILVEHGRLLTANLDAERVPAEEVYTEMHLAGYESLEDVQWAILEPDGKIAIIPTEKARSQSRARESELA